MKRGFYYRKQAHRRNIKDISEQEEPWKACKAPEVSPRERKFH